jgi:LAO/AO transport system kinase
VAVVDNADVVALADAIVRGERRALARAITLVESRRADDTDTAQRLLDALLPHTGRARRVGISGTPGVGKSTFIEALGMMLLGQGKRVAVLAVDPSSPTSGGSILGDKTRMEGLAHDARAYVRPSPSGGALGGIATRTREAMLVCEAAGFDVVLIETVGVGQSEHAVSSIVDTFVLLVAPGGGDDLQGQKRGVLELVDVVVVNKADGPRVAEAQDTANHYRVAGHLLHQHRDWEPAVLLASAHEGTGLSDIWDKASAHLAHVEQRPGGLAARRAVQAERWMWASVEQALIQAVHDDVDVNAALPGALADVRAGRLSPGRAAQGLIKAFLKHRH